MLQHNAIKLICQLSITTQVLSEVGIFLSALEDQPWVSYFTESQMLEINLNLKTSQQSFGSMEDLVILLKSVI